LPNPEMAVPVTDKKEETKRLILVIKSILQLITCLFANEKYFRKKH